MHHCKFLTVMTIVVAMFGPLVGCSEPKQRRAGRRLLGEATRARQLLDDGVLALLANPVYRAGESYAPFAVPSHVTESDIFVHPGDDIHPNVLPTLKKAERLLSSALSDPRNAPAAAQDKAVLQIMLGRVYSLRGYCAALQAYQADRDLATARKHADQMLAAARANADLLDYYNTLDSAEDTGVASLRTEAVAHQAMIESDINNLDQRLEQMRREKAAQSQAYQTHNAQARSMTMEAKLGTAKEGLKKLEKALDIRAAARKAETRVAEIEHEMASLLGKRKNLEVALATAEAQIAALAIELSELQQTRAANVVATQQARRQLRVSLATVQEFLGRMEAASGKLAEAVTTSNDSYEKASSHFRKADAAGSSAANIQQAAALTTVAEMKTLALAAMDQNKRLVDSFAKLWTKLGAGALPRAAQKVRSFLADAEAFRQDAEAKYAQAIKLYQKATSGADRQLRWAWQGELAAAHIRLYRLTKDPETLATAQAVLAEALRDREFSPSLTSVAQLRDDIAAGQP